MTRRQLSVSAAALCAALAATMARAETVDTTFNVTITIDKTCEISSAPSELAFGNVGLLTSPVTGTSTFSVICNEDTAYDLGLDDGGSFSGTRRMSDGTNFVGYELFQDSGHTLSWGDTISTDTVAGTGNGVTTGQSFTIYGRVPAQTTPPTGSYSDTVTLTVTY